MGFVPGGFSSGSGTINHYYLAEDHKGLVEPEKLAKNGETSNLIWVSPRKALDLLSLSPNVQGRYREMKTLKASCDAYSKLFDPIGRFQKYPLSRPLDWYRREEAGSAHV